MVAVYRDFVSFDRSNRDRDRPLGCLGTELHPHFEGIHSLKAITWNHLDQGLIRQPVGLLRVNARRTGITSRTSGEGGFKSWNDVPVSM